MCTQVFIASEEAAAEPGVGMDGLVENNKLDFLKDGPIIWVDSADSQPCMGTAGAVTWKLKSTGKLFHSGLPHKVQQRELGYGGRLVAGFRHCADMYPPLFCLPLLPHTR